MSFHLLAALKSRIHEVYIDRGKMSKNRNKKTNIAVGYFARLWAVQDSNL